MAKSMDGRARLQQIADSGARGLPDLPARRRYPGTGGPPGGHGRPRGGHRRAGRDGPRGSGGAEKAGMGSRRTFLNVGVRRWKSKPPPAGALESHSLIVKTLPSRVARKRSAVPDATAATVSSRYPPPCRWIILRHSALGTVEPLLIRDWVVFAPSPASFPFVVTIMPPSAPLVWTEDV